MAYGSGAPLWGKKQEDLSSHHQQQQESQNSQLNNRHSGHGGSNNTAAAAASSSGGGYQHSGNYVPPPLTGTYAEQQTQMMEDSLRTQYDAEGTSQQVLSQMTQQRYQLHGAHGNVYEMREATERAKRELKDLQIKTRAKKRRLQMIIGVLGTVDFFLFVRLLQCGGSFFCRRHW